MEAKEARVAAHRLPLLLMSPSANPLLLPTTGRAPFVLRRWSSPWPSPRACERCPSAPSGRAPQRQSPVAWQSSSGGGGRVGAGGEGGEGAERSRGTWAAALLLMQKQHPPHHPLVWRDDEDCQQRPAVNEKTLWRLHHHHAGEGLNRTTHHHTTTTTRASAAHQPHQQLFTPLLCHSGI